MMGNLDPRGADVDDQKAMFLFRWYQEMDKNGKVLTGYQNKECKAFYLPLDNGGYGFEWVSNLQVICAIHLKPCQHLSERGVRTCQHHLREVLVQCVSIVCQSTLTQGLCRDLAW